MNEIELIGTILLNEDLQEIIHNIPDVFLEHKKLFKVMRNLKAQNIQITIDSLITHGIKKEYIDKVIESGKQRDLFDSLLSSQVMKYTDKKISEIHSNYKLNKYADYKEMLKEIDNVNIEIHNDINDTYTREELYKEWVNKKEHDRLNTGLDYFDSMGGLRKCNLIIIGARPGEGKTALMTQLIENDVRSGYPVGIITHEEQQLDLLQRSMANATLIDENEIDLKQFIGANESQIVEHIERNINKEVYYNRDMGQDIKTSCRTIRKWVRKYGVKKVYFDYLQIIPVYERFQTNVMRIENVIGQLRKLKNELKITIVLLSQLNRNLEQGSEKRPPRLSDLKDCGQIEQDGEVIILINEKERINSIESSTQLIVAKGRKIPKGIIECRFKKNLSKITEVIK